MRSSDAKDKVKGEHSKIWWAFQVVILVISLGAVALVSPILALLILVGGVAWVLHKARHA